MTRCVVLLRGVNVGGRNRLAMSDFARALESVGCRGVQTYLQSGNAVVDAEPEGLGERVEEALPLRVRVLVRTGAQLAAVVAANPFPDLVAEPKRLHVAFLSAPPDPERLAALGDRFGDDRLAPAAGELFLAYAGGSHASPLSGALLEKRLELAVTARNWTTVTRLADLSRS